MRSGLTTFKAGSSHVEPSSSRTRWFIGCPDQAHAGWLMQNYREDLPLPSRIRFRVVDAEELSSYVGGV